MYAIIRQEASTAPNMVTGIFTILDHEVFILVDPSSTCSFIAYEFALKSYSTIEALGYDMCVSMPARGTVIVSMVVRVCPIEIEGRTLYADLVVIKLKEFNIILGIN